MHGINTNKMGRRVLRCAVRGAALNCP